MQTSQTLSLAGLVFIMGWGLPSAHAEDIGIVPSGAPRASNVRSPRKAAPRAAARPTVPRPIQDETTPSAANASAQSSPQAAAAAATPVRAAPAVRTAPRRGQEESVNLDALVGRPAAPIPAAPSAKTGTSMSAGPHGPSATGILPNFKFYFDFMLRSWKGSNESDFGFDSYHQRLMVEFTPNPDLMFAADLLELRYFETDYMLTPRLQARWGRIWIPFDDMSPHAMFGGRINTSEFRQGNETAFLPDIWADLGIGLKYTLADSAGFTSELHLYVVNGFQEAKGSSPVGGEGATSTEFPTSTNAPYPSFSGTIGKSGDNNNDKAIGARWHSVFGRRFGLGTSVYKDVYTNKDEPVKRGLMIIGVDAQLRPTNTTEIRFGYVTMKVDLDPVASSKASFTRGGTYVELGQRFGADDRWKFLVRAGSSQNDNRVVDVSDKSIVGTTVLKNFGTIEAQVNYFRDLHQVPSKIAYDYGEFRLVTMF